MTTVTYVQTPGVAFQFDLTLDQLSYTASLTWNVFGRRLYFNLLALDGTLVVSRSLIGSPDAIAIQSLVWANGRATAVLVAQHGFPKLATVPLTVFGCTPIAFNGQVQALVQDPFTLSWPLSANPGGVSQLGKMSSDIDLVDGYFQTSSVVYRTSSGTFEINP
jgi:hypothetical protein